jgi:hypothetical protein
VFIKQQVILIQQLFNLQIAYGIEMVEVVLILMHLYHLYHPQLLFMDQYRTLVLEDENSNFVFGESLQEV